MGTEISGNVAVSLNQNIASIPYASTPSDGFNISTALE